MKPTKKDQKQFERDLEAMRGGLLPHYLVNQGEPDVTEWQNGMQPYWIMRTHVSAEVQVWVAGLGASRVYGHSRCN